MVCQENRHRRPAWIGLVLCWSLAVVGVATPARAGDVFATTTLASDATDSQLINPWGISYLGNNPFWISNNGTGVATVYSVDPATDAATKLGLTVTIPGDGSVTGQVPNGGTGFNGDLFLFVSEDGTISGWRPSLGTSAEVLQTGLSANIYKGVTLDSTGGHDYLLSANFKAGTIDVLKDDSNAPNLTGKFLDPNLPANYAPFNISKVGNTIYVTYALQNGTDDLPGPGHGFVNAFDLNGNLLGRIGTMGALNSPWGLAIAPSGFGSIAGDLLVGNFGDGHINVFSPDPSSPAFLGQLMGADGKPLTIDGLWGLIPGNGGQGGSTQEIYFTAGPNDESGGVFGALRSVPEPGSFVLALIAIGTVCAGRGWQGRRRAATPPGRASRPPVGLT